MKRTTKKLTGVGLEVFLRRFYAAYPAIDEELRARLAADGLRTFASVRVRSAVWRGWRGGPVVRRSAPAGDRPRAEAASEDWKIAPVAAPAVRAAPAPSMPPAPAASDTDGGPFDPYAIGLIPTYQRAGADGLRAKLDGIETIDHLRKMARAQQVALPAELRGADADGDAIRAAIVEAVGKRIADRRAAAG